MYTQTTNCIPAVKKNIFSTPTQTDSPCPWSMYLITPELQNSSVPSKEALRSTARYNTRYLQHKCQAGILHGPPTTNHHKYYTGLALQATITLWHIHWLSTNAVFRRFVFKAHLKYCCLLPFLHIVLQVTHDSSVLEGATFWPEPPPATAHTSPTSCILMDALRIIFLPVLKPVRFWVQKQHVPCLQGLPWFGERQ